MRNVGLSVAALAFLSSSSFAQVAAPSDDDSLYLLSLLSVPGKAQSELSAAVTVNPLLTAYGLSIFGAQKCRFAPPSDALLAASGGEEGLKTPTGKRILAVSAVVATMKYDVIEQRNIACEKMRAIIEKAEKTVTQSDSGK